MFLMRFDMRAPSTGAPAAALYAAALDMASWADSRGCLSVVVSEHHAAEDGFLPAPVVLASALAARTTKMPITIAVVLLPLYDAVRLAEEMVVLDILSGGRVMWVAAVGYRREEFDMYGVDFSRRGEIAEEQLGIVLRAKTGEPFAHRGRLIHVTPSPLTPGGPLVAWGGGSAAAARRAGRHGIGFFAQKGDAELRKIYQDTCRASGHEPGMCLLPSRDDPTAVFVADDVDVAWRELGPYLLHDAVSYARWTEGDTSTTSISGATTVDELRAEDRTHRVLTVAEARALVRSGVPLALHPLIGGLPPEIAWRYLRNVELVVEEGHEPGPDTSRAERDLPIDLSQEA